MKVRPVMVCVVAALTLVGCGDGSSEPGPGGGVSEEAPIPSPTVTPGQTIWVAVLATAEDAGALDADLRTARTAVGDYLANRVVVKEASCYDGLPPEMDAVVVLAIQDRAEHGVHAMYEEITDSPAFYGQVTLAC